MPRNRRGTMPQSLRVAFVVHAASWGFRQQAGRQQERLVRCLVHWATHSTVGAHRAGAGLRAEHRTDQAKEQSCSARQAHWLKVVLWQQQHRVAIATKVVIIRSNNRGETFNPLSTRVSAGGSVQHGLSAAGGAYGFIEIGWAADKR